MLTLEHLTSGKLKAGRASSGGFLQEVPHSLLHIAGLWFEENLPPDSICFQISLCVHPVLYFMRNAIKQIIASCLLHGICFTQCFVLLFQRGDPQFWDYFVTFYLFYMLLLFPGFPPQFAMGYMQDYKVNGGRFGVHRRDYNCVDTRKFEYDAMSSFAPNNSSFHCVFPGGSSCPAEGLRALSLSILVWPGTGGHPTVLAPSLLDVWPPVCIEHQNFLAHWRPLPGGTSHSDDCWFTRGGIEVVFCAHVGIQETPLCPQVLTDLLLVSPPIVWVFPAGNKRQ